MHKHFILYLCMAISTFPALISSKEPAKVIAGWVENIKVDDLHYKIKAKLDTGAKTSSIHATNIESFKNNEKDWVRFTLILTDNENNKHKINLEKPRTRKTNIKKHDGTPDKRHVVVMKICFNGRTYNTEFTLADRREYIYDVLLGRQFLTQVAIIDSSATFLTLAQCN